MRRVCPPPDELEPEEMGQLYEWHVKKYPNRYVMPNGRRDEKGLRRYLEDQTEAALLWYQEHGHERASWVACVKRWVRRTYEREGFSKYEPRSSVPSKRGRQPFEEPSRPMKSVGELVPRIVRGLKHDK